jgi:hypothetical protein
MSPRKAAKAPRKTAKAPRSSARRRGRSVRTWMAAGFAPLALGLASGGLSSPSAGASMAGTVPDGGYIEATAVIPRRGLSSPEEEVLETWVKPRPNKSRLGDCGWYGSEGADKETNLRKNRTDLPPLYYAVSFEAITNLPSPMSATTRRDKWNQAQRDTIAPFDGVPVTVTGFVVVVRPQKNNREATNCGAQGEESTDWHIALVGYAGDTEDKAVVVEPTPRIKRHHPNWKPETLAPYVSAGDSVRVSGYLLYDPVHKGHLGRYRQTLWEVHPIHRIEVFDKGRWVDLDAP